VQEKAKMARAAALRLQATTDEARRQGVHAIADAVWQARKEVLQANQKDVEAARKAQLAKPLVDRLVLDEAKLKQLLDGIHQVADAPDPTGRTLRSLRLDEGLELYQITVPIGVIGVVFESRPDALVQISALTLRSGNAALLKGGREAEATNATLTRIIQKTLGGTDLPADAVQLLEGRAEVTALLALDDQVDLIVPRGSSAFVRHILDNTRIPVLGHAEGVCHIYIDRTADEDTAIRVWLDAKTDYPAACNAAETLLVHQDQAQRILPRIRENAKQAGITLIEDENGLGKEFGDNRCALRTIDSLEAAIDHINQYGTRHTDAIITQDTQAAKRFVQGVDASSVLVNASTRFADGYRYGLGAELGIATGKLHARGPVGLEGLVTTKWVVIGQGHQAGEYQGPDAKSFRHEPLQRSLDEAWP
jgi:glutamate-5-semialdehyde dehydrogenase